MVECRPLLGPDAGMSSFKPVAKHRLGTQRTAAGLGLPELLKKRPIRDFEWLTHNPSGKSQPRRAHAASTVLRKRQAIVIGPTPPGTGVIDPATVAQLS